MNSSHHYIHIQSLTMNAANLTKAAYAEAKNTWLCTGCAYPKPGVERVDVHIENRSLQGPLNLVFGCGLPLARRSFLFRLGEERVKRDLYLGDVFNADGVRLDDWVTFRGKRRLIVRGTKDAGYRVCSECGRNVYFAMHPRYLYPQPPTDVELFESTLAGLVFPEIVGVEVGIGGKPHRIRGAEVLPWPSADVEGRRRRLLVERLQVLTKPKDGLPPLYF